MHLLWLRLLWRRRGRGAPAAAVESYVWGQAPPLGQRPRAPRLQGQDAVGVGVRLLLERRAPAQVHGHGVEPQARVREVGSQVQTRHGSGGQGEGRGEGGGGGGGGSGVQRGGELERL